MSEFERRMAGLRQRFRERAAAEQAQIETALAAGDRASLERSSHSLSGAAGIFGYAELSLAAEQVEIALDANAPMPDLEACCRHLLEQLGQVTGEAFS